jgi:cytoskeletal protein CcmA (bactofilin family)
MVTTVFGKGTEFYGDLVFSKSLQINGYFEGEISSKDESSAKGFLVIGEAATVKANIKAKKVIINGTIYGNVEATEKIEIHAKGKLYGNIRTAKLKIADGVVFEGNCEMIKNTKKNDTTKRKSVPE